MLWLKALHIIFVVCWFAGLFYLPRILVYFAASKDTQTRSQLALMARKLYRFVTPMMYLALGFGLAMIFTNPDYYLQAKWLWLKLAGVAALIVYHVQCGHYVRAVNDDTDSHSHVFYRFFNEVPVLFLFGIVLLVVLKPF
ncbi:CopD family protein [Parahaliea sp. F7430]|uniref:Protoporphyrinogen IX oxidase n=1 Tax=Sediminihaliea albiluteola TaxID=2758564 RepID=A0A7W2TY60_9GAMM|nr:CopD family protein [Sediminihaliea albiluteola]MBA6414106.1 CopD family protein [Sediminihaliea albiluteola]